MELLMYFNDVLKPILSVSLLRSLCTSFSHKRGSIGRGDGVLRANKLGT